MIQGHRDGHGYVVRDDGETDIYLPPNEMRAVLHKDRAHFVGRKVDIGLAVIADNETVSIAVSGDNAFEFGEEVVFIAQFFSAILPVS